MWRVGPAVVVLLASGAARAGVLRSALPAPADRAAGVVLRNPTPVMGVGSTDLAVGVEVVKPGGLATTWRLRRVDRPAPRDLGSSIAAGVRFAVFPVPEFVKRGAADSADLAPLTVVVPAHERTVINLRLPKLVPGRYEFSALAAVVRFSVVTDRPAFVTDGRAIGCSEVPVGPINTIETWWSATGWRNGSSRRLGADPAVLCRSSSHRLVRITTPTGLQYLVT